MIKTPTIGSVCECKCGKLGIVTSICGSFLYKGIKLDGTPWESKDPIVVADDVAGFICNCKMDSCLMERAIHG